MRKPLFATTIPRRAPDRSGVAVHPRELFAAHGVRARLEHVARRLFEPVDIASLVVFRIAFGAILLWETWRYFTKGWIARYWIDPSFNFTYYGFDWVQPWGGNLMYVHWAAIGVSAACIMLGLFYRFATVAFFLLFTYQFLLEQARYLNHFYLIVLMSLLLCFVPAHRAFSLDARLRPETRSETVPAWSLWLLRVQIGLVFFFAGVAKLNGDWLRGEPLRAWLAERTDFPVIGRWFTEDWAPYLFSYGGLFLDLLVFPLLLWRRTRPFAFLAALGFHLTNSQLFQIGIFPWLMIGCCLLFFDPDWPRRLLGYARLGRARIPRPDWSPPTRLSTLQRVTVGLLIAWFAVQIAVPLRHWAYPGNVSWTEEGHQFSWHMKLRDKEGYARFFATDPATDETWELDPMLWLTEWQYWKMAERPDMVLHFVHHMRDDLARQGYPGVEIRAHVLASLNGRQPQELVDPDVDLAAEPRTITGSDWIVPLRTPLPPS
jgi:vitamin K-dependent gamma-carboxylase